MSVPAKSQALVTADVHTAKVQLVDTPKPSANEALIKVLSVTLNPTDWKHIEFIAPPGKVVGCDFTGTIVSLPESSKAPYKNLQVGDRVAGYVHGSFTEHGSFAEYITLEPELLIKVPDNVSSEVAASAGIGGCTAAQALFAPDRLALKLPEPADSLPPIDSSLPPVLIWSGSTSVGQWAIQLARAAGYHVITTASPKNHDLVTSLGASDVYDYRDEATPAKIAEKYPNLGLALDCISENGSQQTVVKSLGKNPPGGKGRVVVLLKPDKDAIAVRSDVEIIHTLIYTALGHEFSYGPKSAYSAEQVSQDKANLAAFRSGDGLFTALFAKGLIKGNKVVTLEGGLHGIMDGLSRLKQGLSAEKLAYVISV